MVEVSATMERPDPETYPKRPCVRCGELAPLFVRQPLGGSRPPGWCKRCFHARIARTLGYAGLVLLALGVSAFAFERYPHAVALPVHLGAGLFAILSAAYLVTPTRSVSLQTLWFVCVVLALIGGGVVRSELLPVSIEAEVRALTRRRLGPIGGPGPLSAEIERALAGDAVDVARLLARIEAREEGWAHAVDALASRKEIPVPAGLLVRDPLRGSESWGRRVRHLERILDEERERTARASRVADEVLAAYRAAEPDALVGAALPDSR